MQLINNLSRFPGIKPTGRGINLANDHSAVVEGRTIFPTTVNDVSNPRVKRLLKSGHNSRKIGKTVTGGKWSGLPIYTLTLEERATCPRTCQVWNECYGNGMPYAQRLVHGKPFEAALWNELKALNAKHIDGFVVRLHVLGDFYSLDYVTFWQNALEEFYGLRVFGYTAHPIASEIGHAVHHLASIQWDRFAVRTSGLDAEEMGSVVVEAAKDTDHIVCPAQLGQTSNCATCGLCWHSRRTIAFLRH